MVEEKKEPKTQVNTEGGTYVEDSVKTEGDFIGRDSTVLGDQVREDKIGHDKITGQVGDVSAGAQVVIGTHNKLILTQTEVRAEWLEIERLLTELKQRLSALILPERQKIILQYHLEQLQKTLLETGGIIHV